MRLVLEYCDKGSLRDALDAGAFTTGAQSSQIRPYRAALPGQRLSDAERCSVPCIALRRSLSVF